jgi:hypothetical protein
MPMMMPDQAHNMWRKIVDERMLGDDRNNMFTRSWLRNILLWAAARSPETFGGNAASKAAHAICFISFTSVIGEFSGAPCPQVNHPQTRDAPRDACLVELLDLISAAQPPEHILD